MNLFDLYQHLLKLTKKIGVKLNEDDITSVNDLLKQREEIIDKIKKVNLTAEDSFKEAELNELKHKVINENSAVTKQLEEKFSSLKVQLKKFNETANLRKAYNPKLINEDGVFFDKKE